MNAELEIEKALASITEASEQLRIGLNDVQKFKTATDTLNESSNKNLGLAELLQTTMDRFSTVAGAFDTAAKALSSKGIERFEKQLDNGLDEVRQSTRLVKTEVQSIESSLNKEIARLIEHLGKVEDAIGTIRASLSALESHNEKSEQAVISRISELSESLAAEGAANKKWLEERLTSYHRQATIAISCLGLGLVALLLKLFLR